jgi:hypothetical protein
VAGRTGQAGIQRSSALDRGLALSLLICVAALAIAAPALLHTTELLNYPYPHDGLEGTLLYEARLIRAGQPLYQPLELYRFVSAPYPPLYTLAIALFDLLPGPHVFYGGRLVSFAAVLGVALLATLIVRRSGGMWSLGLLASALVVSAPPVQLWGTRIKPDMLALLLTSLGLYLTQRAVAGSTGAEARVPAIRLSLALAAVAFTCAFFTKQTALAGPLAAGLALLATDWRDRAGDRRGYLGRLPIRSRTLVFAGLYLALALGVWGLLDLWTGGQYSLHVWWGGRRTAWWSFSLFSKVVGLLGFWWPQILLALLAIPLAWRWRGLILPACYLLVAPLTLLGAGEQGSHHNHLLEMHLALALAGCAALGAILRSTEPARPGAAAEGSRPQRSSRVAGLAMVIAAVVLTGAQLWQTRQPPEWYAGELAPEDPPERFLNFIRNTPGEILADDTGLLFQAGRELRYDDPSTMGPAAAIGAWDQRGLLEEIAQRKFSAIMLPVNVETSDRDPSGRWTPEMLAAIREHYDLKFRDRIYTYVPKG